MASEKKETSNTEKIKRKSPYPRKSILVSFVIIGGILLGIFASIVVGYFEGAFSTPKLDTYLTKIDNAIGNGYYERAKELCKEAEDSVNNRHAWTRLLKRIIRIAWVQNSWDFAAGFSSKAVGEFPGNDILNALHVYIQLKQGNNEKAAKIAFELLKDNRYDTLKAEAALKVMDNRAEEISTNLSSTILTLPFTDDPKLFHKAAKLTETPHFALDAALLYMQEGQIKNAYNIVSGIPEIRESSPAPAFIAYDNGKIEAAIGFLGTYLSNSNISKIEEAGLRMFRADLNIKLENFKMAAEEYRKIIKLIPDYSYIPYVNSAWLEIEHAVNSTDSDLFKKVENVYNANNDFILAYAQILEKEGSKEKALNLLSRYEKEEGENLASTLYAIDLDNKSISPEAYTGTLWSVYNKNPQDRRIANFLAWYFYSIDDYDGIQRVLDTYEKAADAEPWVHLYRGIVLAKKQKYNLSIKEMEKALSKGQSLNLLYNMALVSKKLKRFNDGLVYVNRAESLIQEKNNKEDDNEILMQIYRLKAEILIDLSRNDDAKAILQKALNIAPNNLEIRLLLKKLEA